MPGGAALVRVEASAEPTSVLRLSGTAPTRRRAAYASVSVWRAVCAAREINTMKSIAAVLLIWAPLFLPAPASSQAASPVITAADLQQLCLGSDTTSKNVCRVYILGVTQGITVGMNIAAGKMKGGQPCIPAALSGDALEQAVKSKLAEHLERVPEERNLDASGFIAAVMVAKFPCPRPKP